MSIENTAERDPLVHLAGAMSGGTDSYITGMEAAGQRQFVQSHYLPTEGMWEAAEALGIIRGEVNQRDELFTEATLPEGWTKAGTGHDMHSDVLDERGVKRIGVFYKAAFYDRKASFHVVNVGRGVATEMLYGDTLALPDSWSVLTEQEQEDARVSLRSDIDGFKKHIAIVGRDDHWQGRIDRAQAALDLISKEG